MMMIETNWQCRHIQHAYKLAIIYTYRRFCGQRPLDQPTSSYINHAQFHHTSSLCPQLSGLQPDHYRLIADGWIDRSIDRQIDSSPVAVDPLVEKVGVQWSLLRSGRCGISRDQSAGPRTSWDTRHRRQRGSSLSDCTGIWYGEDIISSLSSLLSSSSSSSL